MQSGSIRFPCVLISESQGHAGFWFVSTWKMLLSFYSSGPCDRGPWRDQSPHFSQSETWWMGPCELSQICTFQQERSIPGKNIQIHLGKSGFRLTLWVWNVFHLFCTKQTETLPLLLVCVGKGNPAGNVISGLLRIAGERNNFCLFSFLDHDYL